VWFTENPWPPIVIAGLLALIFIVLWRSSGRGLHLMLAAALIVFCIGTYFAERAIVTEGERLQQRVVELCDAFRQKQREKTLDYVSDSQPALKAIFAAALELVTIQSDFRLSDFQTTLTNENSRAQVHFRANATISVQGFGDVGYQPARLILTFQREKGDWKIIGVDRLNPITGKSMDVLQQSAG
jgi:hypothetical protein